MRVLKFGGTSLATADRIRDVVAIILQAQREEPAVVVVSAFQGVSSQLIACAEAAASGDIRYENTYQRIVTRHLDVILQLNFDEQAPIQVIVDQLFLELNEILQGIFLLKELTLGALDHIASFGERLSANIVAAYLNQTHPAQFVDARKIIFTDNEHTQASVLFKETNVAIQHCFAQLHATIPIVTGFIGSTLDGRTTTLGRNSSDYSAVIIGAALSASRIEIWTDVDGIYSADPQLVPLAFVVPRLSYAEAIELSYFGAKVLHPSTFIPVIEKQIPILIKNTLNPEYPGTVIAYQHDEPRQTWVAKSITVIDDITLLIWQGTGVADVSDTIERLFKSLTQANVHIFLILEASPKHTICLAMSQKDLANARSAIQQEFYFELQHELFRLDEKTQQSIIAIIGDDMKKLSPEVAGKMFQALGKMQINVNAIVQGASERNFSLVVDAAQRTRALNLIHQAFFAKYKCLAIILIGVGQVGGALVQQLYAQYAALLEKKISVTICALANSKKMLLDPHGISLSHWQSELQNSNEHFEIKKILAMLPQIQCRNIALIDCTASDKIVATYPLFIQEGLHIITPNKRANVLPTPQYQKLMQKFKRYRSYFLCRTNVGAGLPILTMLQDLLDCGDTIIKIEGIFSGTLSYLFNHYNGTRSFSRVLHEAQTLGMTEPDPREDLSGMDVARKLLILARHMNWPMELEDIPVENLVPEALRGGEFTEKFYADYEQYENKFKERLTQCAINNTVLRYIGVLHEHKASAQLQALPHDHPLALACHSDNIIAFTTHRYHDMPLVIRGPGAGIEVTAMGVFSDILKLINYLPD